MASHCLATCQYRVSGLKTSRHSKQISSTRQISGSALQPAARCPALHRRLVQRTYAVLNVDQNTFEAEVLQADKPVLLDFWAVWCGPCKLIAPFMDKLEAEYGAGLKVVKLDADANKDLVEKYKVYGLPTVMLFKDGKKVENSHAEGAITLPKLRQYLEKHGIAAAAAAAS